MQNGGCHPKDGCKGPRKFAGAKFRYLAASTVDTSTGKTLLPAYEVKEFEGIPVAFIGLTLKDTPNDRVAVGRRRARVPRRGRDHQRAGAASSGSAASRPSSC